MILSVGFNILQYVFIKNLKSAVMAYEKEVVHFMGNKSAVKKLMA